MVAVDDALPRFLQEAGEESLTLFAASCVERSSGVFFLAMTSDDTRGADVDDYLQLLEDLWVGSGLSSEKRLSNREKIDSFPEMQGEEEPPGILAFAYDAVAAMYYAYTYLVCGDSDNIKYCSNHILNSAGYIDDAVSGSSNRYNEEIAAQLGDIAALSAGVAKADRGSIRERSRRAARDRVEALRSVFQ